MCDSSNRPDAAAMELLLQTEQEYCNITLDKRNRRHFEDSNRVYSLLEELMLGTVGYEWLEEVATRNRTRMDLESILNVWAKQVRFWKIFTTRMKIQ